MSRDTIGALARKAGVSVETLRYYEREGLLAPGDRDGRGWRFYGDEALATLRFIKGAQGLGFSLADVRALLGVADEGARCPALRSAAERKIEEIDARIRELEAARTFLRDALAACESTEGCETADAIGGRAR